MSIKCIVCGVEFEPKNPRHKYCSYTCRIKANNNKAMQKYYRLREKGICVYCGAHKAESGQVGCAQCMQYHRIANKENYYNVRTVRKS